MISNEEFEHIKERAETWYRTIDAVYCPYLQRDIAFTARGLQHIKFKKDAVARNKADQYQRFKNIQFAYEILKTSHTLQEYTQGRTTYYSFIAIVKTSSGMSRFKIIVRRYKEAKPYFWSIIPFGKSAERLRR